MKVKYRTLEHAIGYRFKKRELLELAVTHPSYRYENPTAPDDNQRLEYLGDAVLSLISADYLFKNNLDAREGDMSKLRSQLTADRKLAQIGAKIGVGEFLRLGKGEEQNGGAKRSSNLADAVEAILGAAWNDGGARAANKIFKKVFLPELDGIEDTPAKSNPKGDLQEYAQSRDYDIPVYETLEIAGPEHDRLFTVEVTACGKTWKSTAGSKREGERQCASLALEELSNLAK